MSPWVIEFPNPWAAYAAKKIQGHDYESVVDCLFTIFNSTELDLIHILHFNWNGTGQSSESYKIIEGLK